MAVNPFNPPAKPSCAREAQELANWHWFELMGAQDVSREAEDYVTRWRGDSVAYCAARNAAAEAARGVHFHKGQHKYWAHRAHTLRVQEGMAL